MLHSYQKCMNVLFNAYPLGRFSLVVLFLIVILATVILKCIPEGSMLLIIFSRTYWSFILYTLCNSSVDIFCPFDFQISFYLFIMEFKVSLRIFQIQDFCVYIYVVNHSYNIFSIAYININNIDRCVYIFIYHIIYLCIHMYIPFL